MRILVVDDDPAMVGAITALVGTEGHQVITAYDGLTAVRRFREERPDLVLLDLAMPGPDGFTVAGQIRAEGDAPIVVVSGESSEAAKVRALGHRRGRLPGQAVRARRSCWRGSPRSCAARSGCPAHRPERAMVRRGATSLQAGRLTLDLGRHEARVGEIAAWT